MALMKQQAVFLCILTVLLFQWQSISLAQTHILTGS